MLDSYTYTLNRLSHKLSDVHKILSNIYTVMNSYTSDSLYYETLNLEELLEKACLLARDLPQYTGRRSAISDVEWNIKKCIPIELEKTEENWFRVIMPPLPSVKAEKAKAHYIDRALSLAMTEFFKHHEHIRFEKAYIVFNHIYSEATPKKMMRDHDNIEIKQITDVLTLFLLPDDGPKNLGRIQHSSPGENNMTEILIIPDTDLELFIQKRKKLSVKNEQITASPEVTTLFSENADKDWLF